MRKIAQTMKAKASNTTTPMTMPAAETLEGAQRISRAHLESDMANQACAQILGDSERCSQTLPCRAHPAPADPSGQPAWHRGYIAAKQFCIDMLAQDRIAEALRSSPRFPDGLPDEEVDAWEAGWREALDYVQSCRADDAADAREER